AGRNHIRSPQYSRATNGTAPKTKTCARWLIATPPVISRISYSPQIPSTPINSVKPDRGRKNTAIRTAGSATAAVRTLVLSTQALVAVGIHDAEPAIARLVGGQRGQELALPEIRPQSLGEI